MTGDMFLRSISSTSFKKLFDGHHVNLNFSLQSFNHRFRQDFNTTIIGWKSYASKRKASRSVTKEVEYVDINIDS